MDLVLPGESRLKAFRQRAADIDAEIGKISDALASRGVKGVLTDEERAEFDVLKAAKKANAELLAEAESANERERTYAVARPDADAQAAARAGRVVVVEDHMDKAAKAPGFFGRALHTVRDVALNGGKATAEQAQIIKVMAGGTGANTDTPSEGGYLVGQERSTTVIKRSYSQGEILQRVNMRKIGANFNGVKFPAIDETSRADNSRFGGIVSGWLGQGNDLGAGKPKFREMDMKLRKVGAFVYATDEMNADAVAFESFLSDELPKELTFRTEDAFVNGTGGSMPVGIMQSGAVVTVTRNTANRILSEDLRGMWGRIWAPCRLNAVWLVDQNTEQQFDELSIPIGTSGVPDPSYKPAGTVSGQTFATYKNRPIIPVEYCAALGTSGDVILVNFDEYTAIDKAGIEQAVSLHVAFLTDQACYRFMYRVDGQLNWNAALTPKSGGGVTYSPVVVLS